MASFLENAENFINTGLNNPALIPAAATAYQQWNQADQYRDAGRAAADRADPFGQYRRGYGDQLKDLYRDPSKVAQTPGYQFALNQAMGATESRLRAMGLTGSSQMQKSLVDQASGMAAQTWNQEANRLAMMAGAQFDPANAARMQMEGEKLRMEAQSNALGAIMYPFGPSGANTSDGGVTNPGRYGQGSSAMSPANVGQAAQAIMAGGQAGWQAANKLLEQGVRFVQLPDGSVGDLQQYMLHGADNGSGDTVPYYPTGVAAGYTDDPNSQFYQGPPIPDYTNDGGTPIEPTFTIGDDYGYDPGGSNGSWDFNPEPEINFDPSGGWE
jgi:hypothetical protein